MAENTRARQSPSIRAVLREAEAGARVIGAVANAPLTFRPAERREMLRLSSRLSQLASETRSVNVERRRA